MRSLVIVNPVAGNRRAVKVWERVQLRVHVAPDLLGRGAPVDLRVRGIGELVGLEEVGHQLLCIESGTHERVQVLLPAALPDGGAMLPDLRRLVGIDVLQHLLDDALARRSRRPLVTEVVLPGKLRARFGQLAHAEQRRKIARRELHR